MVETGKNSKGFSSTHLLGPIDLNVAMLQISGWIMCVFQKLQQHGASLYHANRCNPPKPSNRTILDSIPKGFQANFFRCCLSFAGCNSSSICLSKCLEDHSTSRMDSAGCSVCKQRSVPFDSTRSPHGAWKKYETGQNMSKDASRRARRCLNLTSRIFT